MLTVFRVIFAALTGSLTITAILELQERDYYLGTSLGLAVVLTGFVSLFASTKKGNR